ncbi:putative di-, tri-valent inorganic cation transporter [Aspergillus saccharolyticus JOP 1030-1]|uniref:Cation diffusion facilitator family metal ion transporter n=1 Tax=Aspergillus saccharolyticus JOP 1030-1 TaxID=1450539 RepID=A0A319AKS0_9EURO|nr:cation diffusion facilitator family metal ion transporter [Aspergillus saccharolyticus JOP 1030-1]PYH47212.1 cation diffusion facilitator family metal ion transporter [Aspergillus saccharolyticus JOP 1030-1]
MSPNISRSQRLMVVIAISSAFFVSEISVGFYTHSLALVADAFHYLSDLVSFIVALLALWVSEADDSPKALSFGWQRAQLLGAFFNGVLLFGLGISVFLQSVERFISIERVENPKLMFIMGSIGLGLNLISATFLHEHHHHGHDHDHLDQAMIEIPASNSENSDGQERPGSPEHGDHKHVLHSAQASGHGHDLGMMGVLVHVLGDAANNLGVMAAALVIWLTHYEGRYYADPGTTMGISIMILLSSFPLVRRSGLILLQSAPNGVDAEDVKHDLEKISGVLSVHELHIWQLNQHKTLASVHVTVSDSSVPAFLKLTKTINECFHAYGVHSTTIQPEVVHPSALASLETEGLGKCQVVCGTMCAGLTCCG